MLVAEEIPTWRERLWTTSSSSCSSRPDECKSREEAWTNDDEGCNEKISDVDKRVKNNSNDRLIVIVSGDFEVLIGAIVVEIIVDVPSLRLKRAIRM